MDGTSATFYGETLQMSGSVVYLIRGSDRDALVVLNKVRSIVRSDTWIEEE